MVAIHLLHKQPKTLSNHYALVPVGIYANKRLRRAKEGAVIVFHDGWREDRAILVRRGVIKTDTSAFSFLARSIYDKDVGELLDEWKRLYIIQGEPIDTSECLILELNFYEQKQVSQHQGRNRRSQV